MFDIVNNFVSNLGKIVLFLNNIKPKAHSKHIKISTQFIRVRSFAWSYLFSGIPGYPKQCDLGANGCKSKVKKKANALARTAYQTG